MAEFIVNPRRAPRAPARCRTAVVSPAGAFEAETEDVSARGCQVVSPKLVKKGDAIELTIASDKISDPLRAKGRVTWVSEQAPWRVGVAFEDAYVPSAERWFEKLVAAAPGLGSFRRVPQKIPVEAMVYLGPPPRFLLDFTAEEAALLRAIASGVRLDELMARLRDTWPSAQRALFSLLARQAVTLARGQAAHPETWKKILTEVEASLAVESLDKPMPATASAPPQAQPEPRPMPAQPPSSPPPPQGFGQNPAASPRGTVARDPHPPVGLDEAGSPLDVAGSARPRGAGRPASAAGWGTPQAPEAPRTGGWGQAARERGPEAQALYERALLEIEAGHVNGAIALLRKALTHAPHDPDISATLGKLAFKDRLPGGG